MKWHLRRVYRVVGDIAHPQDRIGSCFDLLTYAIRMLAAKTPVSGVVLISQECGRHAVAAMSSVSACSGSRCGHGYWTMYTVNASHLHIAFRILVMPLYQVNRPFVRSIHSC